jgi:hypothetical protein
MAEVWGEVSLSRHHLAPASPLLSCRSTPLDLAPASLLQRCQTHCQVEVHLHYSKLVSHPSEGEWARMAPFRILSVDIECQGRKGHFPEPDKDPVIQIASLVTEFGQKQPTVRNIMTLKSCAPISGAGARAWALGARQAFLPELGFNRHCVSARWPISHPDASACCSQR